MSFVMLLPALSLPTFQGTALKNASVMWRTLHDESPVNLLDFAYAIPLEKDDKKSYSNATTTLLAERYGGQGIGGNGGGVRCGLLNGLQIKGIGKNLLVGRGADFFHSYGGASLNEGMAEAIWGDVLDSALPHGACRVLGLISTGTRVPLLAPKKGQDPTTARALIVRQALLRPAHYMRSPYFDPVDDRLTIISDTDRTRAAVATLPETLRSIYSGGESSSDQAAHPTLSDSLHMMFQRAAEQVAASRAKRIMHGSLIDSNFSIDGRWLDFGTSSCLPDHGRYFISPGAPDFLHEHLILRKTVKELHFYLRKYLPDKERGDLCTEEDLWRGFIEAFERRLPLEFCKLTGVPHDSIARMNRALVEPMYAVMQRIIDTKSQVPYSLCEAESLGNFKVSDLPQRLARYHLCDLLQAVSFAFDRNAIDEIALAHLADSALRRDFVECFWSLRNEYLCSFSEEQQPHTRIFLGINTFRVNSGLPEFSRPTIYGDIERCLLSKSNVSQFVDDRIALGKSVLMDASGDATDLSAWFDKNTSVCVSAKRGIMIQGEAGSIEALNNLPSVNPRTAQMKLRIAESNESTTNHGH